MAQKLGLDVDKALGRLRSATTVRFIESPIDLRLAVPSTGALTSIPKEMVRKHQVLPLSISAQGELILAVSERPAVEVLDQIGFIANRRLLLVLVSADELSDAIDRFYQR